MSYIRIWIHLIWATKNREKLISRQLNFKLINHIRENAVTQNIYIDFLNCVEDHCHALISLGSSQSIQEISRLIKGESSHWVNTNKLSGVKYEWQNEYIAVSISESQTNRVRDYIKNQQEHHRKKSFQEEYDLFIKKYGFRFLG